MVYVISKRIPLIYNNYYSSLTVPSDNADITLLRANNDLLIVLASSKVSP